MRPLPFLLLLILAGCGAKTPSSGLGKTTVANLIQEKGEPLSEEKIPVKDGKILNYPNNEKFQVEGEYVTQNFKDPEKDQKLLLFWRHKFRDCATRTTQLNKVKSIHEVAEFELACDELGEAVIYSEGSDYVSRLRVYESK